MPYGFSKKGHSWGSQRAKPRPTYCRCCSGVFGLAWGKCTSYRWRLLRYHSCPVQREKSITTTVAAQFCTSKDTKAHPLPTPGAGSHSLQLYPSHMPVGTHLGWISRWSGDGLVVMEDDKDQIPVAVEEVPAEPWH